jgi:hypothetical protein
MTLTLKRAPTLVAAALSLFLSLFVALPALSQEVSPEHLALARQYIDLTDQSALYESAVAQAGAKTYRQLLPQNPEIADALNEAITTVVKAYADKKGDLYDQIARVYATVFNEQELKDIVAFYSSPTGTKLAKANAELNPTIKRVVDIFTVNLNSEFFARVRAELKAKGIDT